MKQTEEERLYQMYKMKSDDELWEIINDDSYEQITKNIAKKILTGDRTEYNTLQEAKKVAEKAEEKAKEEKETAQQTDPLYDDIHQIASDVRFIRNVILAGIIIAVIAGIIILISDINTANQLKNLYH